MITKEQTKEMLKDLTESYNQLSDKIKKYEALNLDHWIVIDLKVARENIELSIGQITYDLAQIECNELEQTEK